MTSLKDCTLLGFTNYLWALNSQETLANASMMPDLTASSAPCEFRHRVCTNFISRVISSAWIGILFARDSSMDPRNPFSIN